ncbi:hypothetical protein FOA52_009930 [Chlamydomonas sp. UWO 241]|nr:hypothetical protein FOA52_009930 [Chlamydomonas sp. UWO 241]
MMVLANDDGDTVLMLAADAGHVEAMRLLLDNPSANAAMFASDGKTVLMRAAHNGQVRVMRLLLNHPSANAAAMMAFDEELECSALVEAAKFAAGFADEAPRSCAPLLLLLRRVAADPQQGPEQQAHMTKVMEVLGRVNEEDSDEDDEEDERMSLLADDQPDAARDECVRLLLEFVAKGFNMADDIPAQAQQIASLVDVVSLLVSRVPGAPMQLPHAEPARARAGHAAHSAAPRAAPAAEAAQPARPAAAAAPVASAGGGPATERPASGATRAASARGPSRRGGLPARVGDTSLRRSFVLSIPVARGANWFLAGGGRRMDEEEATAAAAERIAAAAEDGTSLPVRLATDVVRFLYGGTGRREPADGGVVSASLLNAKPAVGGIGVEPRGGGALRVLFTVASDAVADTVVRWRHELRRCVDSTAVFDVLSDREEAQHQALWPAFLAAKVAGKRAQFHRARLVVDAMADMQTIILQTVVPAAGAVISTVMYASPLPTVYKASVNRAIGDINPIPFCVTIANTLIWLVYGLLKHDPFITTPNTPGVAMALWATVMAYGLADDKVRSQLRNILLLQAICLPVMGVATAFFLAGDTTAQLGLWGLAGNVVCITMYASPLSTMGEVIKTRNSASILVPLTITTLLNASLWTAYGLAIVDPYVFIPNGLGSVLACGQLALTMAFPARKPTPGGDHTTYHGVGDNHTDI